MRSIVLTGLLLVGCAGIPSSEADDGHLYEYVRSNRDGSLPETILVYLPSPLSVEVVKIVAPCTDAAYVTAEIDAETGSADRLIAGRLETDGSQKEIGVMHYDAAEQRLRFELGPNGEASGQLDDVGPRWHLYDFDFATLISLARFRWTAEEGTSFDLVRLMPAGDGGLLFENLGTVDLVPRERRNGEIRYNVNGTGLPEGRVVRRGSDGAIVEITSSEKNHAEYRDFALQLVSDRTMSAGKWGARRAAHWTGCPQ